MFLPHVSRGSPFGRATSLLGPAENVRVRLDLLTRGPRVVAVMTVKFFLKEPHFCEQRIHCRLQRELAIELRVFNLRRTAFRAMHRPAEQLGVRGGPIVE